MVHNSKDLLRSAAALLAAVLACGPQGQILRRIGGARRRGPGAGLRIATHARTLPLPRQREKIRHHASNDGVGALRRPRARDQAIGAGSDQPVASFSQRQRLQGEDGHEARGDRERS